nr:Uncharacterised protein [Streptococcus thermophilus]
MDEERNGWAKATPYILIAAYVVGPLVLIPLGSVALVIAFIFAVAAIAGLIDGYARNHRKSEAQKQQWRETRGEREPRD